MKWLSRSKREPGWLAIQFAEESVRFAHGHYTPGGQSAVTRFGIHDAQGARDASREKFLRELNTDRYRCSTLLGADEYQMLLVEAPNVPQAEQKSAIRWRLKDMIDYSVDDATIDLLDIPAQDGPGGARAQSLFAVAARNDVIKSRMEAFEQAKVALSVIDIPETAQRNIAALYEVEGRGIALLHIERESGLLTISAGGELYLARRLEIGYEALSRSRGAGRDNHFERIVTELQRTFDHFERQFRSVAVSGLLLGPQPEEYGLREHLVANLAIGVRSIDLGEKLAFGRDAAPDAAMQWTLFHLLGAALRHETRAS